MLMKLTTGGFTHRHSYLRPPIFLSWNIPFFLIYYALFTIDILFLFMDKVSLINDVTIILRLLTPLLCTVVT